jgi:hypothetical protein
MDDKSKISIIYESINNLENYKKSLKSFLSQYEMTTEDIPNSNQISIILDGRVIGKIERKFAGNVLVIELIKAYETGYGLTDKTLKHDKIFAANHNIPVKIDLLNRIVAKKFSEIFSDWNIQKISKSVYLAKKQ